MLPYRKEVDSMKDFLVMCAKVALGLFIGFILIYGGTNSLDKKTEAIHNKAVLELDAITFDVQTN